MNIRDEHHLDVHDIRAVVGQAFAPMRFSRQTEPAIIDALRTGDAMTLSLVAEDRGEIVGHVAFSPVTIGGVDYDWYGLGPLAVHPDQQGSGIGQALVRTGLNRLEELGARGCVVLGEPDYYCKFGFKGVPGLWFPGAPSEYFMALPFDDELPDGEVQYHAAFASTAAGT